MKTGRLLKFPRPGGDVHAYLYQDGPLVRASLYRLAPGPERAPVHEIAGQTAEEVEAVVREWVDRHFPKPSGRT
jgi:hypothetical protein